MTAAKTTTPYRSGFCHSGRHDRCQGAWPNAVCDCTCHQEPEPEPEPEPAAVLEPAAPTRPRLLDLFCGAGGAGMGYHRAGFDVVGVDLEPHPDYPFTLIVENALETLGRPQYLARFDVIHASPPCQARTTMSNRWRGKGTRADEHVNLIPEVRDALEQWGGPYVIENVPGARRDLHHPITLHGGMFGLRVHRPRLFESNVPLMAYKAPPPRNPVGVYGDKPDGRRLMTRADGTEQRAAASLEEAQAAMGCDWMTDFRDIAESIPPAYTAFLGAQIVDYLRAEAAA